MGEDLCQQVSELETIVNFFLILGNLKTSCELKWCYELGFRFEKPLGGLAKGSKTLLREVVLPLMLLRQWFQVHTRLPDQVLLFFERLQVQPR